jgi:hypothetical protein
VRPAIEPPPSRLPIGAAELAHSMDAGWDFLHATMTRREADV